MADATTFGNLPVRDAAPMSHVQATAIALARRNTGLFLAFLYLQDIFWLMASRVTLVFAEPMYQVSRFEWPIAGMVIIIATTLAGLGIVFARLMRPLPRISVPQWMLRAVVLVAIVFNILTTVFIDSAARYSSGGLTGSSGVLYSAAQALSLAGMVVLLRAQKCGRPFSKLWIFALMGSMALSIDGLASALTICMFAVIIFEIQFRRLGRVIIMAPLVFGLLWSGFQAKFNEIPAYLTPEFMIRWVIGRLSISAEQMYTYQAGNGIIGEEVSYLELVSRAISDRFDLVLRGRTPKFEYPRSVSEAMYFDITGSFGSGASPGALLSATQMGLFFFLPPLVLSFLFMQYFHRMPGKISLLQMFAYAFIFNTLHSNFSEFLTIISPTLLIVTLFVLACLFSADNRNGSLRGLKNS
ncbi:hypothetical protein [Altererythrobacter litoralis]|uniref:Oligosaccharide repeat unit polymerase n=1 Tax=Altererythrobacter litoralis TaxID=3113904 RepID=A0ABU7GHG5_9SPHN|nr:hypothetical protein [Erythrobacteraceae bacterium 1XM1-14]